MTPRPRKATDEEVFRALEAVIGRHGPTEWKLSDVAVEAGITASALVQRFGSKRALLVALSEQLAGSTAALFERLRRRHATPLAVVRAYGRSIAGMAPTPGALAHHLSYLREDLLDPELHAHVRRQARETRVQLRRLLEEAVAAGELRSGCDTAELARTVEVVVNGGLLTWALHREGTAAGAIDRGLRAVLRPVLRGTRQETGQGTGREPGRETGQGTRRATRK